jgi:hypothetical protein
VQVQLAPVRLDQFAERPLVARPRAGQQGFAHLGILAPVRPPFRRGRYQ